MNKRDIFRKKSQLIEIEIDSNYDLKLKSKAIRMKIRMNTISNPRLRLI